ncbi:MAG: hypothetical protein WCK42_03100 [Myxococcaceae bacterium]
MINVFKCMTMMLIFVQILNPERVFAEKKPNPRQNGIEIHQIILGMAGVLGFLSALAYMLPKKESLKDAVEKAVLERFQMREQIFDALQNVGIEQYVEQYYTAYGSSDLKDADVVFLGERHSNSDAQIRNYVVAGSLFPDRDDVIVLDERLFSKKENHPDCILWEIDSTFPPKLQNSISFYQKQYKNKELNLNPLFPKISCDNWDTVGDVTRKMLADRVSVDTLLSELNFDAQTLKRIDDYVISLGGVVSAMTILNFSRHRAMERKIKYALTRYKKVIVIAAFNHVPHSSGVNRHGDLDETEFTQKELRDYLADKKYVSLISKEELML